jgi:ribonuclease HI
VAKKKFYAVRKGHRTGIFTEWFGPQGAQIQVQGFAGAEYRGFPTHSEAQAFLQENAAVAPEESAIEGERVIVYTDGGALGNPGPGGYGVVIIPPEGERREFSGGYRLTTNNRMELMGCIIALEHLDHTLPIVLHSDSRYMVDAINKKWVFGWKKRGWNKADGTPAKNQDLWKRLLGLIEKRSVSFRWVKGHAGHEWNERCDQLAGQAMSQPDLPADAAYETQAAAASDPVG